MDDLVLVIQQGKLRGTSAKDLDGNTFYSFKGIPYARPPLGKLRFKAPLPPLPWQGTYDARFDGNCCYHKDLFSKGLVGSEDCLNLNIYTRHLPNGNNDLKPVMFWIHGGGFTCGSNSSEFYGPEFLITSDVVLVTINYRLGLLGFLSLENGTLEVPGNAGFKDMVMALKWVKNNIIHFNGNPDNVTIFGESAGGAAVHFLMLSPMAQGLFHKAIAQSGCALNPWSRGKRFDKSIFNKIFEQQANSDEEILAYLQTISVKDLLEAQAKIDYYLDPNKISPFGLIIENQHGNEECFMVDEPLDIIISKNFTAVPFIIGYTKMEGMVVNTYKKSRIINMLTDFENNVPYFLGYKTGSKESQLLAKNIKEFYYNGQDPNEDNKVSFYNMVTDTLFLYGIYCTVRKHSLLPSPLYLYRMSIETSLKFLHVLTNEEESGAAHGDDIAYLFKNKFTPPLSHGSIEYTIIKRFVKLWTNFAYYGNPTPENNHSSSLWKKVPENRSLCLLDIDKELTFYENCEQRSLKFWDNIYGKSPKGFKFT